MQSQFAKPSSRHVSEERIDARLWALFALIIYTPLPLGSMRPWALGLLGLLAGSLLLWNIWISSGAANNPAWQGARGSLILLGLWVVLLAIQLVPMPDVWINALNFRDELFKQSAVRETISIDNYSTRLYFAQACVMLAVFWLVLTCVNSRQRVEWLAKVVVFSGLLQALIGVLLMATGADFQLFFVDVTGPRGHGTFVSPNNFAAYLELTLAMGIGLMIAKLDGRSAANWRQRLRDWLSVLLSGKAMLRLALIIMVVGLVASRSRMGNGAFFASLLIVGLFAVIFSKHAARTTVVFIASLIVLDVVIIGGVVGVEKVVERIESTNLEKQVVEMPTSAKGQPLPVNRVEQSVEERGEAAMPSLKIVRDYPWFGTGGGTFHLAFPYYRPAEVYGFYDHPHNDYVEFASEVGLVGFMLLASMVFHSVWRSVKLLVYSRDQLARGMAFASLMGITSLLIHGTVDFNFQNPANAMLFIILISLPFLRVWQTS